LRYKTDWKIATPISKDEMAIMTPVHLISNVKFSRTRYRAQAGLELIPAFVQVVSPLYGEMK